MHHFRVTCGHFMPHIGALLTLPLAAFVALFATTSSLITTSTPDSLFSWVGFFATMGLSYLLCKAMIRTHRYHNRAVCPRCDHSGRRHAQKKQRKRPTIGQRVFHLRDSTTAMVMTVALLVPAIIGMWFVPWISVVMVVFLGACYLSTAAHQVTVRSCSLCPTEAEVCFRRDSAAAWCNEDNFRAIYHSHTRGAGKVLIRCMKSRCGDVKVVTTRQQALAWVINHSDKECSRGLMAQFAIRPHPTHMVLNTSEA